MTEAPKPQRYVAYLRVADRPGTLTAVAEVVSTRGISIESFATGDFRDGSAVMSLVFTTSERLQQLIERTLNRLAVVQDVTVLPAGHPQVLATGVVHPDPKLSFVPPADVAITWSGDVGNGEPLLIEGQLLEVEKVLAAARAEGAHRVSSALLPPDFGRDQPT
ncbi:MAG: ACT domain-containing protein [Propionicimonas sp.]